MKINDFGKGNIITIDETNSFNDSVVVKITGNNNSLHIAANCQLKNLTISFAGNDNFLEIKKNAYHRGSIHLREGSKIVLGEHSTSVNMSLFSLEGKEILIGDNCMFSSRVIIRNSDEHPIYDFDTGVRINEARSVNIGNNVWLAENVTVNKGIEIADGVIVGSCSVVCKSLSRNNGLYAGSPARLIRERVKWDRFL